MQTEKLKSIQNIIAVFTAAALIVSCINLNLYWYTFGINIFDYLSISEILARSAFPIIITSGTFIGLLFAETKPDNPKANKDEEKNKNYFTNHKEQVFISITFITLSAIALYFGEFKALSATSASILILLLTTKRFKSLIIYLNEKSGTPKSLLVAIILITVLSGSYSLGSAINVKEGTIFYQAEVKTNSKTIRGSYIGRSESRIFIWKIKDKRLLIINQQDVKSIALKKEINLNFRKEQT